MHGAWHSGAGFKSLQDQLSLLGHPSSVVELTSTGSVDAGVALGDLYGDAALVRRAIEAVEGDVVVLGHSYGGVVISQAASGCANVKRLLFLAAFMLDAGDTLYSACGSVDPPWWVTSGDKSRLLPPVAPASVFYNRCAPEVALQAAGALRAQSLLSFNQPLTAVAWKGIPSTYFICEADQAIPLFAQEAMSARATAVVRIDSDHSPFLSCPAALAGLLSAAVRA